jgi:hypothetical protein
MQVSQAEYEILVAELDEGCKKIVAAKRPVYTQGSVDVLNNFKQVAQLTGMTVGQVMAVYMAKHVLSLMTHLGNPDGITDEELGTRFGDLRNYVDLAYVGWRTGEL